MFTFPESFITTGSLFHIFAAATVNDNEVEFSGQLGDYHLLI